MSRLVRSSVVAGALLAALVAVPLGVPTTSAAEQQADAPRAGNVLETLVLGKSVRGRPITAWHLDNRPIGNGAGPTVVLIATMHGNERAPRQILRALRGARVIHGVDLWLVPVYNPDGFAGRTAAATRTASTSTATTPTTGPTSTATTSRVRARRPSRRRRR